MKPCSKAFDGDDDEHDHYDHHVYGVRLCLWTAATNTPLFIPQLIYEHGEPWWNNTET
jgi:hypothetical protein